MLEYLLATLGVGLLVGVLTFLFQPALEQMRKDKERNPPTFTYVVLNKSGKIEMNASSLNPSQMNFDLSIVIPAYNEEKRLPVMLQPTLDFLSNWKDISYEILIIDDGSSDKIVDIVKGYILKYGERIKLIKLSRNSGKGAAVKFGMLHAVGDFILMADADGATDIKALRILYDSLQYNANTHTTATISSNSSSNHPHHSNTNSMLPDIAIGSRAHMAINSIKSRSLHRTILMYGFHILVQCFCTSHIKDTQCGFKLFKKEAAYRIFSNLHLDKWAFDIEVIYVAEKLNFKIIELPVDWQEVDGSKLIKSKMDVITTSLTMARDILCVNLCYNLGIWKIKQLSS